MTTFLDQINLFYEIVADDSSSELYPLATVKKMLNEGESSFISEKDNWPWLESDLLFTTIADTTLASAYTAGDSTLTLTDSSTWPTASSTTYGLYLQGDISETWTGNAANVLSGVSGLQVSHAVTGLPPIRPLYKLPSTIGKPSRVYVNGTQIDYIDEPSMDTTSNRFTIYQDYLRIPENDGSEVLRIPYYKNAVELTADDDESLLPEKYRMAPVYYAVGKLLLATDEISKSRRYSFYNIDTGKYEGTFGELLKQAKREYSVKTARNKRRVVLIKRRQSN